jgi:class 3 adenylate cyclase
VPETQYARCGDLSLAYQVFGSGPLDVVVSGSFVTNVEVMWGSPEFTAFFDRIGTFARVMIFDKAGVGLSDPVPKVRTIEERVDEIEALMDTAGFDQAAVIGFSEGGSASILLAATRPERVRALVLIGSTAVFPVSANQDWEEVIDMEPSAVADLVRSLIGAQYAPAEHQIARLQGVGRAVRDAWGKGEAMSLFMPSIRSRQQLGMIERVSASPGMARAALSALTGLDLRSVLPTLRTPTLVVHAIDDLVPVQFGRHLADHIPGARMLEVPGRDHPPWLYEGDLTVTAIEEFLTGSHARAQGQRALRTILFTDIVGSTRRAAEMGDERWHALLDRHDQLTRGTVEHHGGRVIKSTGDGHLGTLDGPAQAIRCAEALLAAVEPIGIQLRIGIHTGECELMGDDIGGIGVHIGARIMAEAAPGEIMVSSTVRDLVIGSGIGFQSRGTHSLKGVPGEWQLMAVDGAGPHPASREARLAAHPTPPVSEGLRRGDRMMAAVTRRAPGVVRGLSRLSSRA